MSDTQWTRRDGEGMNPNTIPAAVIKQLDQQFISKGVMFVVAVGDTVDSPGANCVNLHARALYAQDLYNAGIGFYPLRGNHDAKGALSGIEFANAFPQIVPGVNAGVNNNTPSSITTSIINSPEALAKNPPAAKTGSTFTIGADFSAPSTNASYNAHSYAFTYNNTTFLLLDQFDSSDKGEAGGQASKSGDRNSAAGEKSGKKSGGKKGNAGGKKDASGGKSETSTIARQQSWIAGTLQASKAAGRQAFVFGHKNLLGGHHKDNLFGPQVDKSDPGDSGAGTAIGDAKRAAADAFITSLADNHVHYYICGHDHHHYDSVVADPLNPSKSVHQIISQSDSSKFYNPIEPVSANDTPISQQLEQVGYYVYTVDGPRVTVDYYGAPAATEDSQGLDITSGGNPTYRFTKQLSFGYSLNGKEFLVARGACYTAVRDSIATGSSFDETYRGATMAILGGANGSTAETNYGKAITKAIDTGWAPAAAGLKSDILTLWGMSDVGTSRTDAFSLSMTFDAAGLSKDVLGNGECYLATQDASGLWINAVDANTGGTKQFHAGPWNASYGLGAYGYDASNGTLWAVVNHEGHFAAAAKPSTAAMRPLRRAR